MSGELLGRDKMVQNLSKFEVHFVDRLVDAVEITQALVSNFAKATHPYTDRTGQLTNSIQPGRVQISDKRVEGEIRADKSYASFVELGTSRSRPYPFLHPALTANRDAFLQRIRKAFKDVR